MPSYSGQGQGDHTEDKQRGLGAAFSINLRIFREKFGNTRFNYWHFDLHAGSGHNDEADCTGSPISFIRAAEYCGVEKFFAGFCEVRKDAVTQLLARPEMQDMRGYVFHGDNREFISAIPDLIAARGENPAFAVGSVLADPNGSGIPIRELAALNKACPRLDVFINWSATSNKRHRGRFGEESCLSLSEAIAALGKRHWLIRQPRGAFQWTLLFGRNIATGDHRAMGIYDLRSAKGEEILGICNFTRSQHQEMCAVRQMSLI